MGQEQQPQPGMATCARCSYFRPHIDPELESRFGKCDAPESLKRDDAPESPRGDERGSDGGWMSPATVACEHFTSEPSPGHRRYAGALVFALAWSSSVLPALFWVLIIQWSPILRSGILAWAIVLVLAGLALAVPVAVVVAYRRPPR